MGGKNGIYYCSTRCSHTCDRNYKTNLIPTKYSYIGG